MPMLLNEIPTIGALYRSTVLRAPQPQSLRYYQPRINTLNQVSLYKGDITKLEVDAIVNAANSTLLGKPRGIDGAIHRAAGPSLLEECQTLNGCKTGDAKITGGYDLPAKHVIHTVGPVYSTDHATHCENLLESCYKMSLHMAVANGCETIAFPCISTGVYGYPIRDATNVALKTVRETLEKEDGEKLKRVVFVVFNDRDRATYEQLIPLYFPPTEVENVEREKDERST
ncbi:A1pp-domain-containing protein [Boletus edulis BED1]|uniref:A1pp-domain-containing protein n=1 Tax=Boletus edulis BED1 TaxID=1328754 RepID=A0AAD4BUW9_BOLED|nr:A1pp-domain-containing protein [Boletus edulis BED1]